MTPAQKRVLRELLELGASEEGPWCHFSDSHHGPVLHQYYGDRTTAAELLDALITDRIEVRD